MTIKECYAIIGDYEDALARLMKDSLLKRFLGKFTEDQEIILSQIFPQAATLLAKVLFSKTPEKFLQEWGKKKLAAE